MTFKIFKLETDADGIALVTWDLPGKSMNVLDVQTIEELGAIVDQTTADAAVKAEAGYRRIWADWLEQTMVLVGKDNVAALQQMRDRLVIADPHRDAPRMAQRSGGEGDLQRRRGAGRRGAHHHQARRAGRRVGQRLRGRGR